MNKSNIKMRQEIHLERLCGSSIGTNFYLNAISLANQGRRDAAVLFDAAAEVLEGEMKGAADGSAGRRRILEKLYKCYGALCVESLLPVRMELPHYWSYYIRRRCEIARELGRYNANRNLVV